MKKYLLSFLIILCSASCFAQTDSAVTFYKNRYVDSGKLSYTKYGLVQKEKFNDKTFTKMVGSNFVHIFVDENGNLVSGNLPNGVPWVYYVIHIIHPHTNDTYYNVVQTSGGVNGAIVIRNSTAQLALSQAKKANAANHYGETICALSPADNGTIGFSITKTVVNADNTSTKSTIATYSIVISAYYNASFDVGFLNSQLHNPTYTLVNSPTTTGSTVVKPAGDNNRMMTTVMATLYISPISYLEKYVFQIDVPDFKLKGRSAVADHEIYERIYPTFGLSINESTFQNIFYGINWEVIRGGSLFLGFHTGKINTYNTSATPGFVYGSTAVTADQFAYNSDTKWATKFAIGGTVDLKVVLGLLATKVN